MVDDATLPNQLFMKPRLRMVLALVLVAILAAGIWRAVGPSEPVYHGKTLSRWLENHLPNSSANPPYNSPGWREADEALRKIGTNGIPTLLAMIRAKDPPPAILSFLYWAQRRIPIGYRSAQQRNEEAQYAFEVLGTNAAAAVPELIRIYERPRSASSQNCAAGALGKIGPPAKAALPALIRNFKHTNGWVRFYAVSAVYYIRSEPEIVVPAFRSALTDPNLNVRWNAVVGLSSFGSRARSAVPELVGMLEDPGTIGSSPIKEQVETALWHIAPEKVGKPLVIAESTPMVTNGVTSQPLDLLFNGQRNTLIRPGTPVPCIGACWNSEPRGRLSYYRGKDAPGTTNHHLGDFEVVGLLPPPSKVNAQILCVVTPEQIVLCAHDYNRKTFLEVRRVESGDPK